MTADDEKKTKTLLTPFGEIKILIDGKPIPYVAQRGRNLEGMCPHVLGRYQIAIHFTPDGENHTLACVFETGLSYERMPESGDCLECQSFYNDCGFKMSIGLECESGYIGSVRFSDRYDYDVEYLKNGMTFLIDRNTKTKHYVFGISWIDNVGWNEQTEDNRKRDVETWFGADPTIGL
ncbi:hypothetical protein VOI45_02710 [Acidaminococcus fermentans]|uniref:hypothetical protein n=1 Tax=Acidaminococcus fermentans TaxID=905 RepID=UPI002E775355|nr:hypothetical protein [Acidaminococcus fermentans]MEE1597703.1 hypothetical protein [Acidaminococcus fermentans]MEE4121965.1 hypothetical protein [Acidaminococcus fermentans]